MMIKMGDRVVLEDIDKDRVTCRFLGTRGDVLLFCLDDTHVIEGVELAETREQHPHPAS